MVVMTIMLPNNVSNVSTETAESLKTRADVQVTRCHVASCGTGTVVFLSKVSVVSSCNDICLIMMLMVKIHTSCSSS